MRRVTVAGSVVLAFGFLANMALAQKAGGDLHIYLHESPPSASILEEATVATIVPFMPVFNNLVVYDQQVARNSLASIKPELATSWKWHANMTELTFKLRNDVRWHDGKPFKASDVVCTFKLLTEKGATRLYRNPRKQWYHNIDSISSENDDEVTFHLARRQPAILALLASGYAPIYPCHVSPSQMRSRPVGTGPFKFSVFNENRNVRLIRNPAYWKKNRPYLDGMEFTVAQNSLAAAPDFAAGRFDMTFPWAVTPEQHKMISKEAPSAICETTSMNTNVNFLINRAVSPLGDSGIRRSLMLALERKAFLPILGHENSQLGGVMQPPPEGMWGLSPDALAMVPGYGDSETNRAEARATMAAFGYGPDNLLKLKISTRKHPRYEAFAAVLATQLKGIFISPDLEVIETSLWFGKMERHEYQLALNVTSNGVDDPDQTLYENYSCKSTRNYTGYCSPDLENLYDAQSAETDLAERQRLVHQIDLKLMADAARLPILWSRATTCRHSYVKGYVNMVNSIFNGSRFEDVWLDRQ